MHGVIGAKLHAGLSRNNQRHLATEFPSFRAPGECLQYYNSSRVSPNTKDSFCVLNITGTRPPPPSVGSDAKENVHMPILPLPLFLSFNLSPSCSASATQRHVVGDEAVSASPLSSTHGCAAPRRRRHIAGTLRGRVGIMEFRSSNGRVISREIINN